MSIIHNKSNPVKNSILEDIERLKESEYKIVLNYVNPAKKLSYLSDHVIIQRLSY